MNEVRGEERNATLSFGNMGRLLCSEIDLLSLVHVLKGKHGGTWSLRQKLWGPAFVPTRQGNHLCSRVGNVGKSLRLLHFPREWEQEWMDVTDLSAPDPMIPG